MAQDRVAWRRAHRCVSEDNCVEVATGGLLVGMRSSTAPEVVLELTVVAWAEFIEALKKDAIRPRTASRITD